MRPLALIVLFVPGLALAGECYRPGYYRSVDTNRYTRPAPFVARDTFLFIPPAPVLVPASFPLEGRGPIGIPADPLPPKAAGYAGETKASGPVDLARVAAALQTCVACHSAPRGKGGVALFDAEGRFTPGPAPAVVYDAVASGAMPPRGPRPTDADLAVLKAWAGK